MYGLPRQSTEDLLSTIRLAADLQPDRVALFGYAHVPWFKRRQRVISQDTLPGPHVRLEQSEAARDALTALGYVPIGIDHYARPDDPLARAVETKTIRRNFQGYVEAIPEVIVGFGPSAISTFPQGYAQNTASVGSWRRALDAGHFPIARGHAQTADDLMRSALIEQLMCTFDVDLSEFGGRNAFVRELERLAPLAADGLVAVDGDKLAIPEPMRPFCRLVAQVFDAYTATSSTQHSQAI
jgi:oxygen-independent coproporphyrinogen-3 oxidase